MHNMQKNTNKTPIISIIVPVYKVETLLQRCVESLLCQSFSNFEVLLVDDGSPDRSGEICDEYASKDSRIRVFHKENGGVSSARQMGLENAKGEYTIHADPDDWVEPDMLEELYQKAKETDADMVICDFFFNTPRGQKYVHQRPSQLDSDTVLRELFQQLHGSCWNKFVRRVCYSNYDVKFPKDISFCEDLYVNTCLLKHKLEVAYLPKAFYHYVSDGEKNSLSSSYNDSTFEKDMLLLGKLDELTKNTSAYALCHERMQCTIAHRAFHSHAFSSVQLKKKLHGFKHSVLCQSDGIEKYFLYAACIGYGNFAFWIWQKLRQCRNLLNIKS